MTKFFKNYFIPYEGNDLRPRFFYWETAVIVFSIILFLEILFLVQIYWVLPATDYSANILPGIVVNLTNENRAAYAVPILASNDVLSRAAQLKAEDMAQKSYFSHQSPSGEAPWDFMARAGYDFTSAGENLAVNFIDSEDVVSAWMQSQTHKENILSGNFTEIGIGIARGIYEGREAVFVVQFFGRPFSPSANQGASPAYTAPTPSKTVPPQIRRPSAANPAPASEIAPSPLTVTEERGKTPPTAVKIAESLLPHSLPLAFLKEFFSLPHRMVNYLYLMMFTMILLAFSLMIFIKIRIQHPRLILNGAIMLLLIGSIMVFNNYLMLSQIRIL